MFCEFGTEIGLLFFDLLAYHKLKLAASSVGDLNGVCVHHLIVHARRLVVFCSRKSDSLIVEIMFHHCGRIGRQRYGTLEFLGFRILFLIARIPVTTDIFGILIAPDAPAIIVASR